MLRFALLALYAVVSVTVTGCATAPEPVKAITKPISTSYTPTGIMYCGGWGCRKGKRVSLAAAEWRRIRAAYQPAPKTAEEERYRIAQAIGLFEQYAGTRAGYHRDRGGTLFKGGSKGQLDCFDEASNTTNALGLMERDGLLRYHQVKGPRMRGFPASLYNHATAVIAVKGTGQEFAVDSWFFDSGQPAAIASLSAWMAGWRPDGGATL